MKVEPMFVGQLKTEIETMLNRQLESDEDVLAITVPVLRQGICNTYLPSDCLTESITAAEERRGTRKSGVDQETEKNEMIAQLETNHRNMPKMEDLLNQVRRYMSRAQEENISPCMYLDELPIYNSQTNLRGSTNHATRHSTKTTNNTPTQWNGNPDSDGITDAITQLTQKI